MKSIVDTSNRFVNVSSHDYTVMRATPSKKCLQASQVICQRGVQSSLTAQRRPMSTHHEQASLRRSDDWSHNKRQTATRSTAAVLLRQWLSECADYTPCHTVKRQHCLGRRRNVALQLTHSSLHVTQCRTSSIGAHSGERSCCLQGLTRWSSMFAASWQVSCIIAR